MILGKMVMTGRKLQTFPLQSRRNTRMGKLNSFPVEPNTCFSDFSRRKFFFNVVASLSTHDLYITQGICAVRVQSL